MPVELHIGIHLHSEWLQQVSQLQHRVLDSTASIFLSASWQYLCVWCCQCWPGGMFYWTTLLYTTHTSAINTQQMCCNWCHAVTHQCSLIVTPCVCVCVCVCSLLALWLQAILWMDGCVCFTVLLWVSMFSDFFFMSLIFVWVCYMFFFFRLMFTGMIFTLWFSMQGVNQKWLFLFFKSISSQLHKTKSIIWLKKCSS